MPKKTLRSRLLAQRRAMGPADWQTSSTAAQKRLIALDAFCQARCIALYASVHQEVGTELLFSAALAGGKEVLFPLVCGNNLQFKKVSALEQLAVGSFGILEPCYLGSDHTLETADLIVVPGVAFDLQGHRIGFGKGYYDRCLSQLTNHGVLVGLCHDFQVLEQLPAEGHDIRMQYVVTDKQLIVV